jgi:hypothetical protein
MIISRFEMSMPQRLASVLPWFKAGYCFASFAPPVTSWSSAEAVYTHILVWACHDLHVRVIAVQHPSPCGTPGDPIRQPQVREPTSHQQWHTRRCTGWTYPDNGATPPGHKWCPWRARTPTRESLRAGAPGPKAATHSASENDKDN